MFAINKYRKLKIALALILAAAIIIHPSMVSFFDASAEGEGGEDGLFVTHTVTTPHGATSTSGAALEVRMGEVVEANLEFSTASGESDFYGLKLVYKLPEGTTYIDNQDLNSSTVRYTGYDSDEGTVSFDIYNKTETTSGAALKILEAGRVETINIKFTFDDPSPYPDNTVVGLEGGYFMWRTESDITKSLELEAKSFDYQLSRSWQIAKGSDTSKTIVSDPTVTYIDVPYTITLSEGDIDLKDVTVADYFPEHASLLDGSVSVSNQSLGSDYTLTTSATALVISIEDLPAGRATDIELTLRYDIDRDGDGAQSGVYDGYVAENRATVSGYAVTTVQSGPNAGDRVRSDVLERFMNDEHEATATTTFNRSSAIWGLELSPSATVYIGENETNNKVTEDYVVTLSGGDITLKNAEIIYTLPPHVVDAAADNGGVVDLNAGTITWGPRDIVSESTFTSNVKLTYKVDRTNSDPTDLGVSDGSERVSRVSVTSNQINASGGIGPVYDFADKATAEVTTQFEDMELYWNAGKYAKNANGNGISSIALEYVNSDGEIGPYYYQLYMSASKESNAPYSPDIYDYIPVDDVAMVDTLPTHVRYVDYTVSGADKSDVTVVHTGEDEHGYGGTLAVTMNDISAYRDSEEAQYYPWTKVIVEVMYRVDGDGAGVDSSSGQVTGGTGVVIDDVLRNEVTVISAADHLGNPIAINNPTAGHNMTFVRTAEPTDRGVMIGIESYDDFESYNNSTVYDVKDSGTYPGDRNFDVGDTLNYLIDLTNPASTSKDMLANNTYITITDLPSEVDYSAIEIQQGNGAYDYTVAVDYVTEADKSENHNTGSQATIDLVDGAAINSVTITFTEDVDDGFYFGDNDIRILGTVNGTAGNETIYQATVTFDYAIMDFGGSTITYSTKSDSVWFRVLLDVPWISGFGKTDISADTDKKYKTNQTVSYKIDLTTDANYGTDTLQGLTIIDLVPAIFDVSNTEAIWTNKATWADDHTIGVPAFSVQEAVQVDGQPAEGQHIMMWTFTDPVPGDTAIEIKYDLPLHTYADQGNHDNLIYLTASNAYAWSYDVPGVDTADEQTADGDDYDFDNDTVENRLMGNKATAVILSTDSVSSRLWVSGELDYDENTGDKTYSRFEDYGLTTPGGRLNYRIEIINDGNVPLDDVELLNILPHVGDTEILTDGTSRNSLWTPYLIEAIEPNGTDIVEDPLGNRSSCDVEILYSYAEDPYREDAFHNAGRYGSQEPGWFDEITSDVDLTAIKSLYIKLDNFDGGTLGAGEKATFDITMRAPIGAPYATNLDSNPDPRDVEAAWNAVAMTGVKVDGSSRTQMQWNMPKKVGVAIEDHENGEIGNYVWFDSNNNGLMDDGYDATMASGLNGILVELYKDGENNPVDTTRTGYSFDGVPGFYLFPNLPQDDYYVEFEVDEAYGIAAYNVDGNGQDEFDSDVQVVGAGDEAGTVRLRSDKVEIRFDNNNNTAQNKIDHTVDAGLISATSGAALTIAKVATHVDPLDGGKRVLVSPDEAVNEDESIYYEITVANPGDIDQHYVKVVDDLESDGFRFYDHRFNPAVGSSVNFDAFTEDPNVVSKTNTEVIFEVLKPGESYVLYGIYQVDSGDVDGTDLENTASVWSSEMNDRDDDAHATSEVSVNVAGMSIEKNVTELKRNGDSFFAAAADDIEVEVGDVLRYSFTVSNEGNVDLTDVLVKDAMLTSMPKMITSIPVGEARTVTAEYTVLSSDQPGPIVNTAYAEQDAIRYTVSDTHSTAFQPDSMSITKTVNRIKEAGSDTWQAPVLYNGKAVAELGDTIEYKLFFDNLDYMNLTDVKVVSDVLSGSKGSVDLVPSQRYPSMMIAEDMPKFDDGFGLVQYEVTEADFNGTSTEPLVNTVVGSANEVGLRTATNQVELAGLTITKSADKTNFRYPGDVITYTVTVTNIGSVDLEDVAVSDPMMSSGESDPILDESVDIDAGTSKTFVVTYKTDLDDVSRGYVRNVATASHSQVDEVSATLDVVYLASDRKLSIEKTTGVTEYREAGEVIPYEIVVSNVGEIDFTGVNEVNIVDELLGIDIDVEIAAGESYNVHDHYTLAYTTKADDLVEGKEVVNTASVDCPIADKQEASVTVPYVANVYALSVTKEAINTGEYRVAGDSITYSIKITNEGNTDLNNVVISDPMIKNPATGEAPYTATVPRIAEGSSYTDTVTYEVTKADEALDHIDNEVTVTSDEGAEGTATERVMNRPYNYEMVLDKRVIEAEYREAGDVLHYVLEVTNTSDVALTQVLVEDDMLGLSYTIDEIPVNSTVRVPTDLTAYTVKEEDKVPEGLTNRATATDDYAGESVDFVTVPFRAFDYAYTVTKTVEENEYRDVGDVLNYTITVTSTGDGVLTDVAVIDPLIDLNESIETLAVGETVVLNGTYQVDSDDIAALKVDNTVTVSDDRAGTKTATASVPFRSYTYELNVTKTADKTSFNQRDDEITYTVVVTNEGDIPLENVNVVDPLVEKDELISKLGIGESKTFTWVYLLTNRDYSNEEVLNVVSASATMAETVYAAVETPYIRISSGGGGSTAETTAAPETTTTVSTASTATETEVTTTTSTTETTQSTVLAVSETGLIPTTTTAAGETSTNSDGVPLPTTAPTTTNKYFEQEPTPEGGGNGDRDDDDGTIVYKHKENVREVKVLTPPEEGTLTILDGEMVYAPGPNFSGKDQVVLLITNDDGTEEEITLDIFDDIPQAAGGLPKSGGIPADLWIGLGMLFMGTGLGLKVRRKRR